MILLAAVRVAMQSGSQTALDRVITNWTGTNGYEEFVQAAILARTIDAGDFHRYSRAPDRQVHPQGLPAWLQKTEDFLAGEELSAKRFKPVLKLIRFGLDKPVAYPNKTNWVSASLNTEAKIVVFRCWFSESLNSIRVMPKRTLPLPQLR